MNPEQTLPLLAFIFVMVGTPGPNNLMLMSAGANFGFRRSVPHILGISVGCQVLLLAIALGLGQLLATYPALTLALKVLGGLFLVYMAVQLARPKPAKIETIEGLRPLTFWQAALFQWVNPKAWLMIITAIATFADRQSFAVSVLRIAVIFFFMGLPLISAWNIGGVALKGWLQQGQRLQRFNYVMAALLLLSMYPMMR
ncbi:MAG: LysE family translocator [Gammaproteobacteria bacterium]